MNIKEKTALEEIDSTKSTPIYMQLIYHIKSAINRGEWLSGQAIPTERALAKQLNISRGTVRKALHVLIKEGWIIQSHGSGTFVAPKLTQSLTDLQSFNQIANSNHTLAQHHLISLKQRNPTHEEGDMLKIDPMSIINELVRVQSINNVAVSLQKAILAIETTQLALTKSHSLYEYLADIGLTITHAKQSFRGAIADSYLATHLNIAVGTPLLLVIRKGFTASNIPIEYTYSWHINEYCDFSVALRI